MTELVEHSKLCDCEVCLMCRTLQEIIELEPQYEEFLLNLYGTLANAESDAAYWEMKFKGTWPGDKE